MAHRRADAPESIVGEYDMTIAKAKNTLIHSVIGCKASEKQIAEMAKVVPEAEITDLTFHFADGTEIIWHRKKENV